jgi:hypothetical protein
MKAGIANHRAALDAAGALCLQSLHCGRGASERGRSTYE